MTFMRSSSTGAAGSRTAPDPEPRVGALASRALSVLAARRNGLRRLAGTHLAALEAAVCASGPRDRDAAIAAMRADGIGPEEICDQYVPEVARRLGERWCDDRLSFAQVTIGSARLQSLLRELGPQEDETGSRHAGDVVVMVMAEEHHTLGAVVLTGQLRRMGVSVRLVLGHPSAQVGDILGDAAFDAILISAAARDDLTALRETIASLRAATQGGVPLIIGGGILDMGFEVAKLATGADYATNDLRSALRFSGCDIQAGLPR